MMRNGFKKRVEKGFALIDVMIAALVLATGSVAYMKLQSVGMQQSVQSRNNFQATMVINSFTELLRSNQALLTPLLGGARNNQGYGISARGSAFSLGAQCNARSSLADIRFCGDRNNQKIINTVLARNTNVFPPNTKAANISRTLASQYIMCTSRQGANSNTIRVIVFWNIPGVNNARQRLTAGNCPQNFNTPVNLPNTGYVEFITTI